MKRFVSLLLALCMTFALATTAFAADITQDSAEQTGQMEVSYTTGETYTVVIPADVTVGTDAVTRDLQVKNILLTSGKTLKVTVASANGYQLKNNDSAIAYTVKNGDTQITADSNTVISVAAGTTADQSVTLSLLPTQDAINGATLAGKHTDTLTFTCGF